MTEALNKELSDLYAGYYATDNIATKRALAARDSVDHMQSLRNGSLGRMLDVGAGNGSVLTEIARRNLAEEATALEISASGIEKIGKLDLPALKQVLPFDGYHIPFPDKSFDSAICIHVIEHVEHERVLLREIGRVARDIFVEVPLEGGFRGRLNYKYGHINYYTPLSFRALLETSGLAILSMQVFSSSLAYEQHLYGNFGGRIRKVLRTGLLKTLGPKAAPELMTYLLAAHCTPSEAALV